MSLITRPSIMKKDIISPKDKASNLKKKQIDKDDDQRYTLQSYCLQYHLISLHYSVSSSWDSFNVFDMK